MLQRRMSDPVHQDMVGILGQGTQRVVLEDSLEVDCRMPEVARIHHSPDLGQLVC